MDHIQPGFFRKNPEIYFAVAAAVLGGKIFDIPPANHAPLSLILAVMVLTCALGVQGIRYRGRD